MSPLWLCNFGVEASSITRKIKRFAREWDYKGKSKWYASCPRCKTTVKIPREEQKQQESPQ